MGTEENRQCFLTIPNAQGESQTFLITPEVLPDQLIPLIQKKQLSKENNGQELPQKKLQQHQADPDSGCTTIIPLQHFNTLLHSAAAAANNNTTSTTNNNSNQDNCASADTPSGNNNNRSSPTPSSPIISVEPSSINLHHLPQSASSTFTALSFAPSQGLLQQYPSCSTAISSHTQSATNNHNNNTLLIPLSLSATNQYSPTQQILVAVNSQANSSSIPTIISTPLSTGLLSTSTNNKNQSGSTVTKEMDHNSTPLARLITDNSTGGGGGAFQHKYEPLSRNSTPLSSSGGSVTATGSISKTIRPSIHGAAGGVVDGAEKKKEIRLLKNREAARECRRKKKEYVSCLENRIRRLEEQNKVLVDEIKRMKEMYPPLKSGPTQPPCPQNPQMVLANHDPHSTETTNQNSAPNYL